MTQAKRVHCPKHGRSYVRKLRLSDKPHQVHFWVCAGPGVAKDICSFLELVQTEEKP